MLVSIEMRTEIRLGTKVCTRGAGKEMIPEPEGYGGQPIQQRNNNLLCVAITLFIIGLTTLQGAWILIVWWIDTFFFDPLPLITFILIGIVPTLSGIYVMWKWWKSGS